MIKERKKCVICFHSGLIDYHIFKDFPIYVGTNKSSDHLYEDMHWVMCEKCGEIQLKKLIEESVLYDKSHNAAIGKSWTDHNCAFVNFIDGECHGHVLEIGGGNLHIANLITSSEKIIQYDVMDSNIFKDNVSTDKLVFKEGLFDLKLIEDKKYDFVIHSHVLEHFYDPLSDLKEIRRILKPNGKMIFSVPMLNNMLKKGYTNALNFEHTYYLNEDIVKLMMTQAGFNIERNFLFSNSTIENWCLFASCSIKNEENINVKKDPQISKDFQQFIDLNNNIVSDLNQKLENYDNYEKFIFGGHIFTQFLLNFGLKNEFIYVLDNDENKHDEFLYGTNLIVKSPKILSECANPVVVLKAGWYNEEIKQDILKNINNKTHFLE